MFQDKGNRGPIDRARLSTNENYEMAQWTNHFGADAHQLRELWLRWAQPSAAIKCITRQ